MSTPLGLNDLDYIVLGVILLSGLLALMRGLVREIFSLLSWVGAYFAATKFYPLALPTAHHYLKTDQTAQWGAMAGVFVIALIILMIIGSLACSLIKGRALTTIDRSLGFLYGLARGALVVSLVYLGVVTVMWPTIDQPAQPAPVQQTDEDGRPVPAAEKDRNPPPELLLQAKTRPAMSSLAKTLKTLLPKEIIDKTIKGAEDQKAAAEHAAQQKALDTLSTPAPAGESTPTTSAQ